MQGKIALVTGGTTGIGRATAVAFARKGAKVVFTGRRAEEGAETLKYVQQAGGEGLFLKSDVSQPAEVEKTIRTVIDRFGRIDCACNNAGVEDTAAAFQDQTMENYDKVFGVNVKGLWLCMQQEIRQMTKQGSGAIVNMSSVAGLIGVSKNATYVASKHAVIGFTRAAADEVSKNGIRVNAVAPAPIDTATTDPTAAT